MSILSYAVSLLYLYPLQVWSILWEVHFLLTIGIVVAILAIGMVFIVTAEDRNKVRSDRVFKEICHQFEKEERD